MLSSETTCNLKTYYKFFEQFVNITSNLVTKKYNKETPIESVEDETMRCFLENCVVEIFEELFKEISEHKIKNFIGVKRQRQNQIKTRSFVYQNIFEFPGYNQQINVFYSKNFLDSVLSLLYSDVVLHQSHATGKIIGYVHNVRNQKVREYKRTISIFAHNLFRLDFFFVLKGLRLSVWRTKNLNMGERAIRDFNYANSSDQVMFIDTIKFYQEPLYMLGNSVEANEEENFKKSIIVFLEMYLNIHLNIER